MASGRQLANLAGVGMVPTRFPGSPQPRIVPHAHAADVGTFHLAGWPASALAAG
jgi:hypothetical protein